MAAQQTQTHSRKKPATPLSILAFLGLLSFFPLGSVSAAEAGGFDAAVARTADADRPAPLGEPYVYLTQSGDTLTGLADRFGVSPGEIAAQDGEYLVRSGLLAPGTALVIPRKFSKTTDPIRLFADGEIVYSALAADFDVEAFVRGQGGFLRTYRDADGLTGSGIIAKLARENSVSPKILLALLEYSSGWVTDPRPARTDPDYPMHFTDVYHRGLYRQMMLAIDYLERGYYGWREAKILRLYFADGEAIRLAPDLNAGTVAVRFYFSRTTGSFAGWEQAVREFTAIYAGFFGAPKTDAAGPLYPGTLNQPYLSLPFAAGQSWCFSNGPHGAWDARGPAAAVDFAPPQEEDRTPASRRILSSAKGCVARSEGNAVVLDLDCDGSEWTGWNIVYYHVALEGRAPAGALLRRGDPIGYASNEGGVSTGIHVHMARKFNGEWILAAGALPLELSHWTLLAGADAGEWFFLRGGRAVPASGDCDFENLMFR
jgi:LasA protease